MSDYEPSDKAIALRDELLALSAKDRRVRSYMTWRNLDLIFSELEPEDQKWIVSTRGISHGFLIVQMSKNHLIVPVACNRSTHISELITYYYDPEPREALLSVLRKARYSELKKWAETRKNCEDAFYYYRGFYCSYSTGSKYDHNGFSRTETHVITRTHRDEDGFDFWGKDVDGYDRKGFSVDGRNRSGLTRAQARAADQNGIDHDLYRSMLDGE